MFYFGKVKDTNEWGFDVFKDTFESYIEVEDKIHDEIIQQANEKQKWISADKKGNPVLIDPPPPTEEELKRQRLKELCSYLNTTDWYAIRFADTGETIPVKIQQQRQAARNEISELREELGE